MRLLRAASELRLQGRIEDALRTLSVARDSLPEASAMRADAIANALRNHEKQCFDYLQRVERSGRDDSEAYEALARATDPVYFDFHKDMLPRVTCDASRLCLLRALQEIDDPRAAESVARAWLSTQDQTIARLCEGLLQNAAKREPLRTQEALAGLLQRSREHAELRGRAVKMLEILTAHAAAPPRGR
jgi:hypothetical protein